MNEAQKLFGMPPERSQQKVRPYMVEWVQEFIRHSPFAVMASSDSQGNCDASPKGGEPGFAKVIDDRHLLMPDVSGNRLFQSYENLETNPKIGLFFLIPGIDATARVNGTIKVLRAGDSDFDQMVSTLFSDAEAADVLQLLMLTVDESYAQCPKALAGAEIWDTSRIDRNRLDPPIRKWVPGT